MLIVKSDKLADRISTLLEDVQDPTKSIDAFGKLLDSEEGRSALTPEFVSTLKEPSAITLAFAAWQNNHGRKFLANHPEIINALLANSSGTAVSISYALVETKDGKALLTNHPEIASRLREISSTAGRILHNYFDKKAGADVGAVQRVDTVVEKIQVNDRK